MWITLLAALLCVAQSSAVSVPGGEGIVSDVVGVDGASFHGRGGSHTGDDAWSSSGDVGLYVWTVPRANFDPADASHRRRLVAEVTSSERPIRFVYLSNYRSGGVGHMHDHASLRSLARDLHAHNVKIFALYTEINLSAGPRWNFFKHVAEFNKAASKPDERFDGIAMNWEGDVGGLKPTKDMSHWVGMYAEAKRHGLQLHNALRHWWDAKNVGSDVFKVIIDNSDAVNVMAYSSKCYAGTFVADEAAYAAQRGKKLYVALETMALGTRGGAVHGETFADGGEAALVACMSKTAAGFRGRSDAPAGFVIHYYLDMYASGKPGWPSHSTTQK